MAALILFLDEFLFRNRSPAARVKCSQKQEVDTLHGGASAEDAHNADQRELGSLTLLKDVTRETWGWLWLERLAQDLCYALRQLRKASGFTLAAVGTLAHGLGATAAMFNRG